MPRATHPLSPNRRVGLPTASNSQKRGFEVADGCAYQNVRLEATRENLRNRSRLKGTLDPTPAQHKRALVRSWFCFPRRGIRHCALRRYGRYECGREQRTHEAAARGHDMAPVEDGQVAISSPPVDPRGIFVLYERSARPPPGRTCRAL